MAICPAFSHFFSEKFSVDNKVWADRVYLHIEPKLKALWLNDVYVSPVDRSDTARGRLTILLYLVRDEHGLFSSGSGGLLAGQVSL